MTHHILPVILAGGFGTRIKHLLPNLPKPMAPVAEKPFIEWIIRYLHHQGLSHVILSTGHLGHLIADYFQTHPLHSINIDFCQEKKPLGTAGGFMQAATQVATPPDVWLVMNGDSLVFTPLFPAIAHFDDPTIDGVIIGVKMADASRYGLLVFDENNNLVDFAEKRAGSGVINAGVYFFRHRLLSKFPSHRPLSFEQDVFPTLLKNHACFKVHIVNAPFLDIGTPESLPQAEAFIGQNAKDLIEKC